MPTFPTDHITTYPNGLTFNHSAWERDLIVLLSQTKSSKPILRVQSDRCGDCEEYAGEADALGMDQRGFLK
jgi:hypothetical protein